MSGKSDSSAQSGTSETPAQPETSAQTGTHLTSAQCNTLDHVRTQEEEVLPLCGCRGCSRCSEGHHDCDSYYCGEQNWGMNDSYW